MREFAAALGWSLGKLQHYEDVYGKPHLPVEVYLEVRDVLMARGIDEDKLRELLMAEFAKTLQRVESQQAIMIEKMREMRQLLQEAEERLYGPSGKPPDTAKKPH